MVEVAEQYGFRVLFQYEYLSGVLVHITFYELRYLPGIDPPQIIALVPPEEPSRTGEKK
jgi:hypothetical protein